jgi:hypothetical protein
MRALRTTLYVIGVFQLVFGLLFLIDANGAAKLLNLGPSAPPWATWLLAMMGGRFLGYAYGMYVAARAPRIHVAWIDSMIAVQVIDWIATLKVLSTGQLDLQQVSTASFAPVLFIAALLWFHPRRTAKSS